MTHALYRHSLDQNFPVAVQGDGMYLIDRDGKRYIDSSGGAAVSCLGHSNERVRAVYEAVEQKLTGRDSGRTASAGGSLAQERGSRLWLRESELKAYRAQN